MSSSDGKAGTSLTCTACGIVVNQAAGTRRTICPNCGSFYNTEASSLRNRNNALPRGSSIRTTDNTKSMKNEFNDVTPSSGNIQLQGVSSNVLVSQPK